MATPQSFGFLEVKAFLEGMFQQIATTLIYGNQFINPERFTGLALEDFHQNHRQLSNRQQRPRWRRRCLTQHRIRLKVWGDDTAHATFPKGKITGLQPRTWVSTDGCLWQHLPSLPRSLQAGDRICPQGLAIRLCASLTLISPNLPGLAQRNFINSVGPGNLQTPYPTCLCWYHSNLRYPRSPCQIMWLIPGIYRNRVVRNLSLISRR